MTRRHINVSNKCQLFSVRREQTEDFNYADAVEINPPQKSKQQNLQRVERRRGRETSPEQRLKSLCGHTTNWSHICSSYQLMKDLIFLHVIALRL